MISSKGNIKFKKLKKLSLKKYRDLYAEFLIFGEHLVQEALKKKVIIEIYTIYPSQQGILISHHLMKELNKNKTLYQICALCRIKPQTLQSDKILVLDDIQDPSNVGILLRSACAFDFKHVFSSSRSVDFYNEKTIRTSQGAIFHLSLERGNLIEFLSSAKKNNYTIFSSSVNKKNINLNNVSYLNKNKKKILILGNEGAGVSSLVEDNSDYSLYIDINNIESLNVGVAGSILMHLLK
ncbi:MAG: RNA methyltransferase [Phytoplasma sp.]|uniref:TrmH family RNA methyltransferase n=1 Tax=Phytoplasma sp. TaxID=2155 RepID=UPI002B411695|nr:RNA methyltransferase [Phytoplasma sp.]WRH06722.1 MAG: RNA methyltransferase [Phytoplasma sp.]